MLVKGFSMSSRKVLELTVPLSPLLRPGETAPHKPKRIRPADTLNLINMRKELESNILFTLPLSGGEWSVVSVFSPYSPDVHVMVIETSVDRYIPGPEWIPDEEGERLMELWSVILDFLAEKVPSETIHVGYNWSPRAWGEEEEKGGFQSIPTKWHAMLWDWPVFPEIGEITNYAKWIDVDSLTPPAKRVLVGNSYSKPFGNLIKSRIKKVFTDDTLGSEIFPPSNWKIDNRIVSVQFDSSIQEVLRTREFFSRVLKPIGRILEGITKGLTEAMTTFDCSFIDRILIKTENGPLTMEDLEILRAAPDLRSKEKIVKIFRDKKYPTSLLKSILEPVEKRCRETEDKANWWRKGFGYSLVLSSFPDGKSGELRILPGVYVGPGGMVEAHQVVLKRPENQWIPKNEMEDKSRVLWELADCLKNYFK